MTLKFVYQETPKTSEDSRKTTGENLVLSYND